MCGAEGASMANDQHVAILKQGVAAWNAWREKNPDVRPDLSEAELTGADLVGAKLSGADLAEADLQGAILIGADFSGADLTDCCIHGVSAWRLKLNGATQQQNLVITQTDEPAITVDNIEVA